MKINKGIILAGGTGSRLYPLTVASNKQLLPIYDKPVLYYPLTTLMLADIREILIISTSHDLPSIQNLLGNGRRFGMHIQYQIQENANGLPEAFLLGEHFIHQEPVAMILGDNFFHGHQLSNTVKLPAANHTGAHIFTYPVDEPSRYGIIQINQHRKVLGIEEKPSQPKSNLAITGLYYFDETVVERSKTLTPSLRGELEIVDLINTYLYEEKISFTQLGRGYVWLDVGTPKSLLDASQYVEVIQTRQGSFVASPEEVALRMGFINEEQFQSNLLELPSSKYRAYLTKLLQHEFQ